MTYVNDSGAMHPAEWESLKEMFYDALELPPEDRAAFVERVAGHSTTLRTQLESLLTAHGATEDFLETPAAAMSPDAVPSLGAEVLPSRGRVGPYRLLREIGRGGMGAVYLATRDDGEFEQQVAVKLVKRGMDTDVILARFRRERQVLAGLDHPNIARLLDGGTTPDGVPYFVMEYVQGQSIGAYCTAHNLSSAEQLTLFRTVCTAVQHAHQNLVVHRDIKSGNILVADDGTPKLLDFGIARLLDPERDGSGEAQTDTLRAMTPEYASPEQLRGGLVTTATDVYSLGVLLYEILTGRRPFAGNDMRAEDVVRAVCDTDAPPPSTAVAREATRRALRGDLDTIVLKAMHKEPSRRYHSVEAFSDDIGRFLAGHPVTARRDTLGYRVFKFAQRNRVGLGVALLVLVSLVGGLGATIWQARIANRERLRAERRFADVRALATSFLFEVHDAIANLPGATPARALLVKRGLNSLDALAREAAGDTLLERELAAAYQRLGLVQGNSYNDNLGDSDAALKSYRASVVLLERSIAPTSSNAEALSALAVGYKGLANMQNITGDIKGSVDNLERALIVQRRAVSLDTGNVDYRRALSNIYYEMGDSRGGVGQSNIGDIPGALASYRAAVAQRETLHVKLPNDVEVRGGLANTLMNLGILEQTVGDTLGLPHLRRGVDILEKIVAENPNDGFRRVNLLSGYMKLRRSLADEGQYADGIAMVRRVADVLQPMVAIDTQNTLLARNLGVTWNTLGQDLRAMGDARAAIEHHRRALAIMERLRAAAPKSVEFQQDVAFTHGLLADAFLDAGDVASSVREYERAIALKKELQVSEPASPRHVDDLALLYAGLGDALDRSGRAVSADAAVGKAVPLAEAAAARAGSARKAQSSLASIYQSAGSMHVRRALVSSEPGARAAHCDHALVWLRKSQRMWEEMRGRGTLPGSVRAQPDSVAAAMARCGG
ncbi:MAG: serine/threonine protein kinase [Gemmatimonadaceae bacterium]|nr:serine/threonine protein kinase [Gemmatimonadaceae bacterium]